MKELTLLPTQLTYLCEEAIRAGCQGHRAELFASEVARASAALEGRQVTSEDLKTAVKLAIAPRGTFVVTPEDIMDMPPPPPPPPPLDDQLDQEEQEEQDQEDVDEPDEDPPEEEEQDQPDVPDVPQEVSGVKLPELNTQLHTTTHNYTQPHTTTHNHTQPHN